MSRAPKRMDLSFRNGTAEFFYPIKARLLLKRIFLAFVAVFLMVSSSLLLSGCGGGDTSSPEPTPAGHGALTFSGTGSTSTGTSFNAVSAIGGSQWYSVDTSAGLTYPCVVVYVVLDSNNTVSLVQVSKMTSAGQGQSWLLMTVPPAQVTVTATDVTFTNLVLPGYGGTTTTSLTVNGTLKR